MAADERDEDREVILARRKRWVAMALAGVAATTASACAHPCLSPRDAGPRDAGPQDAGVDADRTPDTGP